MLVLLHAIVEYGIDIGESGVDPSTRIQEVLAIGAYDWTRGLGWGEEEYIGRTGWRVVNRQQ